MEQTKEPPVTNLKLKWVEDACNEGGSAGSKGAMIGEAVDESPNDRRHDAPQE